MISRTPSTPPRRRLALASVLALGGFAMAFATSSTAYAQEAAPAAPAATSEGVAPSEGAAAPAAATPEDEEAKKKAAESAAPAAAPAAPAPTTTPAPATAAPASGTEGSVSVTFGSGPKKDEPAQPPKQEEPEKPKVNPFRGSMLILDQSMATRTFSKDSQLSYQPTYEWWISPRLFYTTESGIRFGLRQDVFKEFTNTKATTDKSEWEYTDTWLSAAYRIPLKFISDHLSANVQWTVRPGISKISRASGQYLSTGPGASLAYSFPLAGEKSKWFPGMSLSASGMYWKAFTRCNTACGGVDGFGQQQMTAQGTSFTGDQVRPTAMTGSMLVYILNAHLEIFEHFDYSASMIWFSQFANDLGEARLSDGTTVPRNANDTRLRQGSWFFTMFSYGLTKEFTLAAGYWNSNTVLNEQGNYRNPFWSPEARVFFDVYVHLDELYEKLTGANDGAKSKAGAAGRVF